MYTLFGAIGTYELFFWFDVLALSRLSQQHSFQQIGFFIDSVTPEVLCVGTLVLQLLSVQ